MAFIKASNNLSFSQCACFNYIALDLKGNSFILITKKIRMLIIREYPLLRFQILRNRKIKRIFERQHIQHLVISQISGYWGESFLLGVSVYLFELIEKPSHLIIEFRVFGNHKHQIWKCGNEGKVIRVKLVGREFGKQLSKMLNAKRVRILDNNLRAVHIEWFLHNFWFFISFDC